MAICLIQAPREIRKAGLVLNGASWDFGDMNQDPIIPNVP